MVSVSTTGVVIGAKSVVVHVNTTSDATNAKIVAVVSLGVLVVAVVVGASAI